MSAFKKIAGLVAGISCVGALGVAVAQGVPPDARVANPALGAGQQSPFMTPMGETGVPAWNGENQRTALLVKENQTAMVAPAAEPVQPVAEATQTQTETVAAAPAPVAEPAPSTTAMGAGPAPDNTDQQPAAAPMRSRADRN